MMPSCHSSAVPNKKTQPFRAGLWSLVGDVQERVPIGSHRLHQQFTKVPRAIRNSRFHGRGDAQRLMDPAEVVVGEVQAICRPQVLPLLRERVRQPREAAHLHSDREVLAFHMAGADLRRVGIAHDWDLLRVRDIGRAVGGSPIARTTGAPVRRGASQSALDWNRKVRGHTSARWVGAPQPLGSER